MNEGREAQGPRRVEEDAKYLSPSGHVPYGMRCQEALACVVPGSFGRWLTPAPQSPGLKVVPELTQAEPHPPLNRTQGQVKSLGYLDVRVA